MTNEDKKVIQNAEKIVEDTDKHLSPSKLQRTPQKQTKPKHLVSPKDIMHFQRFQTNLTLAGTLKKFLILRTAHLTYRPFLLFENVTYNGYVFPKACTCVYTNTLAKSGQLLLNHSYSFTCRLNPLLFCVRRSIHPTHKSFFYSLTSVGNLRYITAPNNLLTLNNVPMSVKARVGYLMLLIYPPLIQANGEFKLNYKSKYLRECAADYLKWKKQRK